MKKYLALNLLCVCIAGHLWAQQTPAEDIPKQYKPQRGTVEFLGTILPLRDLTPQTIVSYPLPTKPWRKRNYFKNNEIHNLNSLPKDGDPLAKNKDITDRTDDPEITPFLNFEGLREPGVTPPDPTGDIGKNHYMQMVNAPGGSWFQIWNKEGLSVYGPALSSTIWSQVNSGSIGDPIVQYDHAAERWLMMEMQGENQVLIAISDDSDPLGSWKAYRIQTLGFPDYPKLYVWPNAYYITVNEIVNGNECTGYALDRQAMLNGATDIRTFRFKMPNYNAIQYQPATGVDWEGGQAPPANTPGMIMRVYDDAWDGGNDHLEMWQIQVNWQDSTQNFALGPIVFNTEPFETRVCFGQGLFNCIEQPNTSQKITAIENIIMYRAPYRNFGTHESIVLNHISDVSNNFGDGGDAGVRWYELRRDAGQPNWYIYQQGTYSPDLENRFTGTLSMDGQGNIGLGYTVASTITFPGIRLTGRRSSDNLGQMPLKEYTLIDGGKSHADERWGDYSNMAVDPEDDKTFWFTSEYQPAGAPWGTRIGTFQISRDSYDVKPAALVAPVNSAFLTNAEPISVRIENGGLFDATGVQVILKYENQIPVTESINQTIPVGSSVIHTFAQTANFSTIGQVRKFEIVTKWTEDESKRNDTLRTTVKKLTSYDAALLGPVGLPNLICTSDYTMQMQLKNTSGIPLDSAIIRYKVVGNWQTYNWTGHLLPGKTDTVPLLVTGLNLPQHLFSAQVYLPNGQQDQDTLNDKSGFKIYTNLSGAFLQLEARTDLGNLHWELRGASNVLIDSGLFTKGMEIDEVCTSNSTCYTFKIRSTTFSWSGLLRVRDLFGNIVFEATSATPQNENATICTPARKDIDVGAYTLIAPVSGNNLTNTEPVTIAVRNFGLTPQSNIELGWRLAGGTWNTEIMTASITPGATKSFTFSNGTVDLGILGNAYNFELRAIVAGDQQTNNDSVHVRVFHLAPRDMEVLSIATDACGDPGQSAINVELKVHNNGLNIIDSYRVNYILNGVAGSEVDFQPIQPGATTSFFFSVPNSVVGVNQIAIDITDVNEQGEDFFTANDTLSAAYTVYADGFLTKMTLFLDDKPQETRWQVETDAGAVVASGGPYSTAYDYVFENICLRNDACYKVRLFDSGGDGMLGSFELRRGFDLDLIWDFDGASTPFTNEVGSTFCAPSCSNINADISVYPPSSSGGSNGKIIAQGTGGVAPYEYSLDGIDYQSSPLFFGISEGTYTVYCRDSYGCSYQETVTLAIVGTKEPVAGIRKLTATPNPTAGLVWLSIPALATEQYASVAVFDAHNRLLRTVSMVRWDDQLRGNFSLETQPAGMYVLRAKGLADGKIMSTIVVKK